MDGSPVVINRKSELAESDHDAQFNLIVYTLERAIQCQQQRPSSPSPPPSSLHSECRQQWVWMLDLRNFNRQSSTPLSETQRVVDTLQSHYVERLQMAIILDAPLYFSFIFKVPLTTPSATAQLHPEAAMEPLTGDCTAWWCDVVWCLLCCAVLGA